jgi:hypothetical protein
MVTRLMGVLKAVEKSQARAEAAAKKTREAGNLAALVAVADFMTVRYSLGFSAGTSLDEAARQIKNMVDDRATTTDKEAHTLDCHVGTHSLIATHLSLCAQPTPGGPSSPSFVDVLAGTQGGDGIVTIAGTKQAALFSKKAGVVATSDRGVEIGHEDLVRLRVLLGPKIELKHNSVGLYCEPTPSNPLFSGKVVLGPQRLELLVGEGAATGLRITLGPFPSVEVMVGGVCKARWTAFSMNEV